MHNNDSDSSCSNGMEWWGQQLHHYSDGSGGSDGGDGSDSSRGERGIFLSLKLVVITN
jgi:hypothetical protein